MQCADRRTLELAQALIRLDTDDPTGNERAAERIVETALAEAGIAARLIGIAPAARASSPA